MPTRIVLALAVLALLLSPAAPLSADTDEMASIGDLRGNERIVHVLNRMAYGPRPGEVERVREEGLYRWIVEQLHPDRVDDSALEGRLAKRTEYRKSATDLARELARLTKEDRAEYAKNRKRLAELRGKKDASREEIRKLQAAVREYQRKSDRYRALWDLASVRVVRATCSERQLEEVMVDFWFNHFNVFARKGQESLLVPEFEESVIRPHVFGRFRDLLGAVAKSPAMLYYLDNFQSIAAPGSKVIGPGGRVVARPRRAGGRGINENYARELMELHTLGVDGGYTQKDVIEVARCFTGWSITSPAGRGKDRTVGFEFRPSLHDAGEKTVMGHELPAGRGIEDGEEILDFLARQPATARFLSGKLCRKFVSDDPPEALVARVAQTYLTTDGDLRLTLYRIFTSSEFFSAEAARAKLKTPFEFAVSAIRALGAETEAPRALLYRIGQLGEPVYFCEPPTGFADVAEKWSGSNSVLARLNFASALAFGRVPGVKVDAAALLEGVPRDDPAALVDRIAERLLGGPLAPESRAALVSAVQEARAAAGDRRRRASPREAAGILAALVLGSPDFQMQ